MAAVADRTYTFRAPADLGGRMREAGEFLDRIAETTGSELAEKIAAELVLAIFRDSARFRGVGGNQSAFVRETVELVVAAAEKVASDIRHEDAYALAAASKTDDEIEFRHAARARAGQRWRDT